MYYESPSLTLCTIFAAMIITLIIRIIDRPVITTPTTTHMYTIKSAASNKIKSILVIYRSVLGKRPWALKHNLHFWPAWALTRDINSICLYGSCNSDPLKFGTWALTREWVLARDTTVIRHTHLGHYWDPP